MNEKKSKNIIIIALCITLIFMGVGFSLLTQTLTVNTTATVRGSWDVHFKSFTDTTSSLASTNTTNQGDDTTLNQAYLNQTNTTATVTFDLFKPGDQVQYTGVIKNYGNINAVLTSFSSTFSLTGEGHDYITRSVKINGTEVSVSGNPAVVSPALTLSADDGNETSPEDDEATVVITYTFDSTKTNFPTPNAKSDSELTSNDVYRISDTISFGFTQANNG